MPQNQSTHPADPVHAEYDGLSVRFNELIGDLDERTAQVLAAHFTVERELDITLGHFLAQPDKLGSLKFGHKVQVLKACCPDPYIDVFVEPAVRLDNLRNALAHNNKAQVDGCFASLMNSFDGLSKDGVKDTAAGIVTAARILTEGLTFIRVENFSYIDVKTILAAHVAGLKATSTVP